MGSFFSYLVNKDETSLNLLTRGSAALVLYDQPDSYILHQANFFADNNILYLIRSVIWQSFVIPIVSVSFPRECHALSVHHWNPVMCGFFGAN